VFLLVLGHLPAAVANLNKLIALKRLIDASLRLLFQMLLFAAFLQMNSAKTRILV